MEADVMGIRRFWINHGRRIGRVTALAILAGAAWVVADQWFGTVRRNGRKTAANLGHIIQTRLRLPGITVEPNSPKMGDVTITGVVDSRKDVATLMILVEEWRKEAWPSEIYMDVKTTPHSE